jgi:hypothetical protein
MIHTADSQETSIEVSIDVIDSQSQEMLFIRSHF